MLGVFTLRLSSKWHRLAALLLAIAVFAIGTIGPFSGASNPLSDSAQAATLEKINSNTDWCDVGMTAAQCGIYTTFVTSDRGVITRDEVVEYVSGTDAISLAQAGLSYSQSTGVWSGTLLPSAAGKRLSFNVNYYDSTFKLRQVYGFSVGFAQTLEWNPTNTAIVASPTLPSEPARVTSPTPSAPVITYYVNSQYWSTCQVNLTTGAISFSGTLGECVVTARVEAFRSGATSLSASVKQVTFNIVGWPTISSLSPNSGPTSGGTTVRIDGTQFFGVRSVKFGSVEAQSFSVSSGQIFAVSPVASSTGAVIISVTNAKGSVSNLQFNYFKGSQNIYLEPSTTQAISVGASVALSSNGYLGTGARTYAVTSGTQFCSISGTTLAATGVGDCTVTVNIADTAAFLTATSAATTFRVSKATQVLSWSPSSSLTLGQSPYIFPQATSLGGAAISYSVVSSNGPTCTISSVDRKLNFSGIGECVVRVSTPATNLYAAGQSERTLTIGRSLPQLTWSPNLNLMATQDSHDFGAATTLSDSSVSYSVTNAGTTNCSLSSAQSTLLVFSAAGSCEVTATVARSDLYEGSTSVVTFAIGRSSQSLSWLPTTAQAVRFESIDLSSATTVLGGGAITYAVTTDGAGCVLASANSPQLSITSAGSCTVTAYAAETSRFAAGSISKTFTFTKSSPIISWQPVSTIAKPESSAIPSALVNSPSGLSIRYSVHSAGTSGCSVDEFTAAITVISVGSCEIIATSLSTDLYQSTTITQTFNFVKRSQSLTLGLSNLRAMEGDEVTVTASGHSGSGSLSLSLLSGSSCSVSGMKVSALSPGRCELELTISEDDDYESSRATAWLTVVPVPAAAPQIPPSDLTSESKPVLEIALPVPGQSSLSASLLPPAPTSAKLVPNYVSRTATLTAKMPPRSSTIRIVSTVIEVRDAKQKLIARISISLKDSDDEISVVVPYASSGFKVSIFNVNEFGVSVGAPATSHLLREATSAKGQSGVQRLLGVTASEPIFFKAYSATLDRTDKKILDKLVGLVSNSQQSIYITGYAHLKGSTKNEVFETSLARARNVAKYLSSKGVRVWIRYNGAGAPPKSAGWKDRRVELRVTG